MAILLSILLSVSVFGFQHSVSAVKPANIAGIGQQNISEKANSTFSVDNYTSVNIGTVTVHLASGSDTYINVTSSGTYTADISDSPVTCSINGQYVTSTPTWITIDAHTAVRAAWSGSNITVDREQQL
jgi:hypothetical protein